ncbi:MAG: ABC transporter ATP-binding protein [Acetivibrionales bacterium]|jgi:putative ABC transport system ATP-binding protein|nr:ABC transporter ATP-binding protein [Bacillota bacterium]NLP08639.1 ABC transporter ATP-binding protein [Clostridiaceae bacterium]HOA55303.1 ABC transporter ATP-binding protein [Clostridiales bacterium]HQD30885.1 ABC transporter ATP-binding protein [Clostridiales bacterium]
MSWIIKTENLSRDFKSGNTIVHALKSVSIEIKKGKLTILRGRSGSGKTTLINLLGALDKPNSGTVVFNGIDITRAGERVKNELRRKHMGFVFQSVALISMMSAYENVEFGLRIAGAGAKGRSERARQCLSLVGLGKRMDHRPHELSGGEQQRVAIARAIAHRPDVVFADEPTAELDTQMGLQVVKLFRNLVELEGLTVVMTTHDPSMIEIADHVLTLEDGEIIDAR